MGSRWPKRRKELIDSVFAKLADENEVPENDANDTPVKVMQTKESESVQKVIKGLGKALLGKVTNKRIQILMEQYPACYDTEYNAPVD